MSNVTAESVRTVDKLGLITRISEKFGADHQLGKKALQKIVHILEEGFGAPTGYSFSLHTYGAFSRDLAGDLDIARSVGGVAVDYIDVENRYIVVAGKSSSVVVDKASSYLNSIQDKLDAFSRIYGNSSVRQLELSSTLIFLLRRKKPEQDDIEIVSQLIQLKPKYSVEETKRALPLAKDLLGK